MSTVHVTDVCRALWHLTSHGNSGDVFNLADKSDSSKSFVERVPIEFLFDLPHKQNWSTMIIYHCTTILFINLIQLFNNYSPKWR